jgi:hypothetical protein
MPGDFTEVPAPVERNALGAWAGWFGEGVGGVVDANGEVTQLGSLFVGTGSRSPGGGGSSRVFRLDAPDGVWEDDGAPSGAETISKMRTGIDPATREPRFWAFFESPHSGQTWLMWRLALSGPSPWHFENVPTEGPDVGGEGVGVPIGGTVPRLIAGASTKWAQADQREGRVFEKQADGSWKVLRFLGPAMGEHPTLMWSVEFDALGRYWQFWNDYVVGTAYCFVDNRGTEPTPGGDISDMMWFGGTDGWMYAVGANGRSGGVRNAVYRNRTVGETAQWELVHTFEVCTLADHVLAVPRGEPPGELWVMGHEALEAAWSLDGLTWTRDLSLPPIASGSDANHLCAMAYYDGSVWIIARDAARNTLRCFRDKPGTGATRTLSGQVI